MPLPGLRGSDHFGVTVPDLDEADDFLVRVLGAERFYDLGPFAFDEGDWMAEHLNVHPRTVMRRLRFYRLGNGTNLEVFEYEPADGQRPQPRNSDLGGHHLAIYVDDLDEAVVTRLQETAVQAYQALQLRDYGRIDFRLQADGTPHILEVNPNPYLLPDAEFSMAARKAGRSYTDTVSEIVDLALARYGAKS